VEDIGIPLISCLVPAHHCNRRPLCPKGRKFELLDEPNRMRRIAWA